MKEQIEIHPNHLYSNIQLEDLGYTLETICEIADVDPDVFNSHNSYTSALYVANEIAEEINAQIHKEFFNGENSEIDDERYELTSDGEYTLKYKFTAQFTKFSGEDILTAFGINGEGYFEPEYQKQEDEPQYLYSLSEQETLVEMFGLEEAYRIINE